MPTYETVAVNGRGDETVLYTGSDPVTAVNVGLDDETHWATYVREDGVKIPGTVATS